MARPDGAANLGSSIPFSRSQFTFCLPGSDALAGLSIMGPAESVAGPPPAEPAELEPSAVGGPADFTENMVDWLTGMPGSPAGPKSLTPFGSPGTKESLTSVGSSTTTKTGLPPLSSPIERPNRLAAVATTPATPFQFPSEGHFFSPSFPGSVMPMPARPAPPTNVEPPLPSALLENTSVLFPRHPLVRSIGPSGRSASTTPLVSGPISARAFAGMSQPASPTPASAIARLSRSAHHSASGSVVRSARHSISSSGLRSTCNSTVGSCARSAALEADLAAATHEAEALEQELMAGVCQAQTQDPARSPDRRPPPERSGRSVAAVLQQLRTDLNTAWRDHCAKFDAQEQAYLGELSGRLDVERELDKARARNSELETEADQAGDAVHELERRLASGPGGDGARAGFDHRIAQLAAAKADAEDRAAVAVKERSVEIAALHEQLVRETARAELRDQAAAAAARETAALRSALESARVAAGQAELLQSIVVAEQSRAQEAWQLLAVRESGIDDLRNRLEAVQAELVAERTARLRAEADRESRLDRISALERQLDAERMDGQDRVELAVAVEGHNSQLRTTIDALSQQIQVLRLAQSQTAQSMLTHESELTTTGVNSDDSIEAGAGSATINESRSGFEPRNNSQPDAQLNEGANGDYDKDQPGSRVEADDSIYYPHFRRSETPEPSQLVESSRLDAAQAEVAALQAELAAQRQVTDEAQTARTRATATAVALQARMDAINAQVDKKVAALIRARDREWTARVSGSRRTSAQSVLTT